MLGHFSSGYVRLIQVVRIGQDASVCFILGQIGSG